MCSCADRSPYTCRKTPEIEWPPDGFLLRVVRACVLFQLVVVPASCPPANPSQRLREWQAALSLDRQVGGIYGSAGDRRRLVSVDLVTWAGGVTMKGGATGPVQNF